MLERHLVAEEERLVGGHRLDHVRDRAARAAALELRDESAERWQGRPCGRPAAAGSRPDIACRPTARGRSAPSGACADSRNRAGVMTCSPANSRVTCGAICVERQHRRADAGMRDRARHAPHHAGRFVLRDHAAAGRDDFAARRACRRSPCRSGSAPRCQSPQTCGGGGEQRIDRGLAEIDRRAVVERDHGAAVAPRDRHVAAAGREIDRAGTDRLAVARPRAPAGRWRAPDARRGWW